LLADEVAKPFSAVLMDAVGLHRVSEPAEQVMNS
jgi:hypothetical protein